MPVKEIDEKLNTDKPREKELVKKTAKNMKKKGTGKPVPQFYEFMTLF